MKHERFMIEIEGYYGEYQRKETRNAVYLYIRNRYTEKFLGKLYKQVLISYSGQFHYAPDICIVQKAAKDITRDDYQEPSFKAPAGKPDKKQQAQVAELFLDLMEKYKENPEIQKVLRERRREEKQRRD